MYFNIFIFDVFACIFLLSTYALPAYLLSLESFEDQTSFAPDYYNNKLQNISEGVDELLDS